MIDLNAEWERCRPWLAAALERAGGTHGMGDVRAGVEAVRFQFWPGERAAIVTEIIEYPRMRALHFFLVGGAMDELLAMKPHIEAWGKGLGCTRATCAGRFGWERVLTDYRRACVVLEKEI
jgi:hypothetical protein